MRPACVEVIHPLMFLLVWAWTVVQVLGQTLLPDPFPGPSTGLLWLCQREHVSAA